MTLSKRERQISAVVLVVAAIFVVDRLALTPYLERRRALTEEAEKAANELAEVRRVMKAEGQLRRSLVNMGWAMSGGSGEQLDPSEAEGRLLTFLHDWERQAGVAKASFQRLRSTDAYGFTRLTFQVSATGRMAPIAALLYRVETAAIPRRIEQLQIMLSGDSGEELQVQFTVSMLCRTAGSRPSPEPSPAPARRAGSVAALDTSGGRR